MLFFLTKKIINFSPLIFSVMYYSTKPKTFFTRSRIQGLILLTLVIFIAVIST